MTDAVSRRKFFGLVGAAPAAAPLAISSAAAGAHVRLSIENKLPADAEVTLHAKPNDSRGVDFTIVVEKLESEIARNIADGRGAVNSALFNRYGLTPKFS